MSPGPSSATTSFPRGSAHLSSLTCFLVLAAGICGYSLWVGPIGFMGDSYLFADRAKHLWQLGNLDLNNHSNLIYPPLFSIILAPFYALGEAGRILTAITLLNSLLVASAVFPVSRLVHRYAGVSGWERWFFTLLISASPTFVCYAPMVLSEACYIPLIYWTAYTVFRSLTDLTPRWFFASGLLMATGLLLRSAATSMFLAGSVAWLLGLLLQRVKPAKSVPLLVAGLVALAVPVLAWHWFEKHHVTYQGGAEYSISSLLRDLMGNRADQVIKLHWTLNGVLYFLLAPLNLGALLALVVALRRSATVVRDPLLPFVVAVIALAIVSIVVVAPTGYGGNLLTWNKYFAPFVGLTTLVALRLRLHFTRRDLAIAILVAFILVCLRRPSGLVCHFPDALTAFMDSARPLPIRSWLRDLLFFLLLCSTVPLFLPGVRLRARVLAAVIATGLGLLSLVTCARYWGNAGWLNFKHYDGMAVQLEEARRTRPTLPAFYDPAITTEDPTASLGFLFYYPRLLPELLQASLFPSNAHLPDRFLYVTRAILPSARLVTKSRGSLRLYEVDRDRLQHDLAYEIRYGQDVGGSEVITVGSQPVTIRWLGPTPEFSIHLERAAPSARLSLHLAIGDHPRKVIATLNGRILENQPVISRIVWQNGSDEVVWQVALQAGDNRLTLKTDSEPLTLPDGARKVTFLLIDDPVLSQP